MAFYRKLPVIIEAIQFTERSVKEVYEFINSSYVDLSNPITSDKWDEYESNIIKNGYSFKSLESDGETQKAIIGDFIIKSVNDEFYPCKPDIFEKTYEIVN